MKASCFALLALAIAGFAHADRPIVIEESATIESPNSSWTVLGKFGVAIDGDDALVSAERFVPDENAEGGMRHDGVALLYRRANATTWNYVGMLGPVGAITEWVKPALAMKGGVAMVIIDAEPHIFERSGTSWTESSFAGSGDTDLQGHDIEIDSGRILVSRVSCLHNSVVIAKSSGTWRIQGELQGHPNDCGDNPPGSFQDLEGGRAVIFNDLGVGPETEEVLRIYRPDESGVGWRQLAVIQRDNVDAYWGPEMAVAGMFTAINRSREFGTQIYHEVNQSWSSTLFNTLQPVDGYLQPEATSGSGIKRVFGSYFAQRNYSYDRGAYVVNLFRVSQDLYYSTSHLKTLQAKQGHSLGDRIDSSSNNNPFHERIIVSGRTASGGDNIVRIFEMPEGEKIAVQRFGFEDDPALAEWSFVPGSSISIVAPPGETRVMRQSSTAGDAGAWLPNNTATAGDHSIQADVTVRSFNGADRWVGLVTRRTDAANYYYVTLRSSGVVQIKRMQNGTFTTLASAPATVQTGRKYRLRLESIGTALRVYLDERKVLTAYDSALTSGNTGVQMYRTSADFDNVIVTPSARATMYTQNFSQNSGPANWKEAGTWTVTGGVFRQSFTSGDARAVVGTGTADQIVQVRVRATSFIGASSWVGVIARYADASNYLYVSLRPNNTITVRRLVNGQIQQIASLAPGITITPGQWYTVRIEIVNDWINVYVNNTLMLGTGAPLGPNGPNSGGGIGQVGLVTYRAAAEYDDFVAYQP